MTFLIMTPGDSGAIPPTQRSDNEPRKRKSLAQRNSLRRAIRDSQQIHNGIPIKPDSSVLEGPIQSVNTTPIALSEPYSSNDASLSSSKPLVTIACKSLRNGRFTDGVASVSMHALTTRGKPEKACQDLVNGVPTSRKGWYRIHGIVNESRMGNQFVYLVEWAGRDPKPGIPWPDSWIDSKDVSKAAIKFWEKSKGAMKLE
ncbi:hypothetical protein F5Y15DRAFT_424073 [Xylariaceae sp. FL0016]|nr:hypothetical protein F5Y15DRAFT_424073 [Xylariaceae sp. FL0016]